MQSNLFGLSAILAFLVAAAIGRYQQYCMPQALHPVTKGLVSCVAPQARLLIITDQPQRFGSLRRNRWPGDAGVMASEFTHPLRTRFSTQGMSVDMASIQGGRIPIDSAKPCVSDYHS